MLKRSEPSNTSFDTLRLSTRDVDTIMESLDAQAAAFQGRNRRREKRYGYNANGKLVVTIFHPGGSMIRYAVKPRNLSSGGVSFLHGGYLHLGTRAVVSLEPLDGNRTNMVGQVVRCVIARANIHEIGIRFHDPIDLRRYLTMQDLGEEAPVDDIPQLSGRVLYVEPTAADRERMRTVLQRIGVAMTVVADGAEGLALVEGGLDFDMVFTEASAGTYTALQLAKALHQQKADLPVMVVTQDPSPELRQEIAGGNDAGVIAKPFSLQQIHAVLLQVLPLAQKAAA